MSSPIRSPCLLPDPLRIYRSGWGVNTVVADVSAGQHFEAMELGPESEASDIYVFPLAKSPPTPSSSTDYSVLYSGRDPLADAIHLKSGEAYVGPIVGPLLLAPRGFNRSAKDARDASAGGSPATKYDHRMELILWPVAPHWFRRSRPDAEAVTQISDASGTVAETTRLRVPAFGREDALFSYEVSDITGGTLTVRIYGVKAVSRIAGVFTTTLLTTVAITADGKANYEYEGKFDFYEVSVQSASVTTVSRTIATMSLTLRDK